MNEEQLGTGAEISAEDIRTIKHEDLAFAGEPLIKGGVNYVPDDIEHQHRVGICTAISFIQNREKANGKKYSADFQYLLQKKYFDKAWYEGSSIFHALKVGYNFGLLPLQYWFFTTEQDRYLPYEEYSAKLEAITDEEIKKLLALCEDKIAGYASVNVSDPQAIAKAINESEAGILCRYDCGSTWWTPSWLASDINPLRKPIPATSGHAIIMSSFDYTLSIMQNLANTWGSTWCKQGNADINWENYKMTEAWSILKTKPEPKYIFTKLLKIGMRNDDVKQLQKKLGITTDGIFGNNTLKAVKEFQKKNNLVADGIVGKNTNAILNK